MRLVASLSGLVQLLTRIFYLSTGLWCFIQVVIDPGKGSRDRMPDPALTQHKKNSTSCSLFPPITGTDERQ